MSIRIRKARFADAARIAEIHVSAARATFAPLLRPGDLDHLCVDPMTRRWAPLTLTHDGGFLVAEDGGLLGFCYVTRGRRGCRAAEIMALYVDPRSQSQGIGTRLMYSGLDHAHARGYEEISLWVLPENGNARRFYESFGFSSDRVERLDHGLRITAPHVEYRCSLAAVPVAEAARARQAVACRAVRRQGRSVVDSPPCRP